MLASTSQKTILLIINSKARNGSAGRDDLISALRNAGHKVIEPGEHEDCRDAIREHQNHIDLVVLGGGDGTINYVLSSLVETQLPFVVYPMGTANLLARSFKISADINELVELIRSGVSIPIDLGMVNGVYFINVCGLGISTEVNKSVPSGLKKKTGAFSFWIHGMRLIRHLEPFKIKLTVDDEAPVSTRTWQITICNGKKYAAWMTIEPDASYDDGLLRCLSTEITNWWEGFKLLPSYLRGTYRDGLDVRLKAGRRIKIESKKTLSIDVDGDVKTTTPAIFEVKSKVLNIVLPAVATMTDDSPISEGSELRKVNVGENWLRE